MNCPKCEETNSCKDGIVNNRQRYQCKSCSYRYTVVRKSDVRPSEVRRMALSMYLEGLNYRVIGKILRVNYVTVFYWIKEWGEQAQKLKSRAAIRSVEIKELHAFVGRTKKTKGYVLLLMDIKKGSSLLCCDADDHLKKKEKQNGKQLNEKKEKILL